ncbi:hypothetical protein HYALB_00000971 [Hymenoscyphus albidus]|uniref:Uncharacterized protein n=1 Tax=Hymenoscyphus albidus TaxID=595503 RepID=A0A9N9M0Z5_9HELO|nr:hypothetical protein HYALB_00000971 [Hymenoscyphus albidus]
MYKKLQDEVTCFTDCTRQPTLLVLRYQNKAKGLCPPHFCLHSIRQLHGALCVAIQKSISGAGMSAGRFVHGVSTMRQLTYVALPSSWRLSLSDCRPPAIKPTWMPKTKDKGGEFQV